MDEPAEPEGESFDWWSMEESAHLEACRIRAAELNKRLSHRYAVLLLKHAEAELTANEIDDLLEYLPRRMVFRRQQQLSVKKQPLQWLAQQTPHIISGVRIVGAMIAIVAIGALWPPAGIQMAKKLYRSEDNS